MYYNLLITQLVIVHNYVYIYFSVCVVIVVVINIIPVLSIDVYTSHYNDTYTVWDKAVLLAILDLLWCSYCGEREKEVRSMHCL